MKSTVESLDPARIKLTVEVPYEELKPSLDAAYKEIGSQIQVPGFRRGHVPNRIIDQRVGRGAVIQDAVNEALPGFYRDAVTESGRVPLDQPEVEITELPAVTGPVGGQLVFTAEVPVRPEFDLPELEGTEVTVDAVEVTDEDVEAELDSLRARFGSLKPVTREVQAGDFVTIDLKAVIDGEEVDSAAGISYEIGKGNLLEGLDDALIGLKAEDSATFTSTLAGGEHEGEEAEVTVTATAVKERELPEADDAFAEEASEFDTIAELREGLASQIRERKVNEQAVAAREALLKRLLEETEFEVPDSVIDREVKQHLSAENKEADDAHGEEIRDEIAAGLREQILLDVLAEKLEVSVTQDELIEFLVQTSQQYGMEPAQFMQGAQRAGQIPVFLAEIARNKSLVMALRHVTVKDSAGEAVDLTEFIGSDEADAQALLDQVEEETDEAEGIVEVDAVEAVAPAAADEVIDVVEVDSEAIATPTDADAEGAASSPSSASSPSADSAGSAESASSAE